MKNIFEEIYQQETELKKQYDAADDAGKDSIRAERKALMERIASLGGAAPRIWREYEKARENGNEFLDINDVVWDKDVELLVTTLRKYGIEKFTFSSGWSSAVDTAWLFQQNGCKLEGLVEISGNMDYLKGEHEKLHGYLFSVN